MIVKKTRPGILWVSSLLALTSVVGCDGEKATKPSCDRGSSAPVAYPLGVGNTWSYDVHIVSTGRDSSVTRTDTITEIENREDGVYSRLEGAVGGSQVGTSLLRQSRQTLFLRPEFGAEGTIPAELEAWFLDRLGESYPWTLADFAGGCGELDRYGPADTTFGGSLRVQLTIVISSLGRGSVTVPMGAYSDVYMGRATILLTTSSGSTLLASITIVRDIWIKDGIGLLQDVTTTETSGIGGSQRTTDTSQLRSFTPLL
jgi:hypothetical protein